MHIFATSTKGGRERGCEGGCGGREGGSEGAWEGGRERGAREGGREGEREGGREGGRELGRVRGRVRREGASKRKIVHLCLCVPAFLLLILLSISTARAILTTGTGYDWSDLMTSHVRHELLFVDANH